MKTKINIFFIPAVFALTIFLQCILFHYLIYNELLFSTLWHSPEDFFRFYLPATTIAVFFAALVFLFKHKWWTFVASIIINIWIWANLWYFRANGILVDKYAVSTIGSLYGFWDSILALISPIDFIFLGFTLLLATTIYIFKKTGAQKSLRLFFVSMIVAILMGLANGVLLVRKNNGDYSCINPFKDRLTDDIFYYVQDYTIIHHFFFND